MAPASSLSLDSPSTLVTSSPRWPAQAPAKGDVFTPAGVLLLYLARAQLPQVDESCRFSRKPSVVWRTWSRGHFHGTRRDKKGPKNYAREATPPYRHCACRICILFYFFLLYEQTVCEEPQHQFKSCGSRGASAHQQRGNIRNLLGFLLPRLELPPASGFSSPPPARSL